MKLLSLSAVAIAVSATVRTVTIAATENLAVFNDVYIGTSSTNTPSPTISPPAYSYGSISSHSSPVLLNQIYVTDTRSTVSVSESDFEHSSSLDYEPLYEDSTLKTFTDASHNIIKIRKPSSYEDEDTFEKCIEKYGGALFALGDLRCQCFSVGGGHGCF
ncbi:hypothetical protein AYI68_g148 [Smittium mucronatum]|uniref:Uncharacterized protein n=1 Tax=Smittium mucronatum TaxID=133383 RepID=A0A1R0H908_9FUNG|nr:hypothetical protein AYI68_g148 [Smittium mucronatum]